MAQKHKPLNLLDSNMRNKFMCGHDNIHSGKKKKHSNSVINTCTTKMWWHIPIQKSKILRSTIFFFQKNHKVHLLFQTLNNICISPLKSIIFNRCVDNKSAVDIHFIIRKYSLCFSEIHKRVLSSFFSSFLMNRVLSS